jgi:hypothetical protein
VPIVSASCFIFLLVFPVGDSKPDRFPPSLCLRNAVGILVDHFRDFEASLVSKIACQISYTSKQCTLKEADGKGVSRYLLYISQCLNILYLVARHLLKHQNTIVEVRRKNFNFLIF